MEYSSIVNYLDTCGHISCDWISGVQAFMLLHDKKIKGYGVYGAHYTFKFVPIEYEPPSYFYIADNNCKTFDDATNKIKQMIDAYNHGKRVYLLLEDEMFELQIGRID